MQCVIDNCERDVYRRRPYCLMHYQRDLHGWDMTKPCRYSPPHKCSIDGCAAPGRTKGMCDKHYSQKRLAERRARIQQEKLGRGCADCGYNTHPAALDFDHLPGTEKRFSLSHPVGNEEAIEAEMAKCEVVCANCHRVRTANRRVA